MLKEYKNILVINLMHLGDLMLVTPVLRTLRANYPGARITLLADKKLRDLVEFNPHLDECLFLDKKGEDNHPGAFFRFIMKVRAKHFDLAINLHRNERASALAAFSGAGRIVGYAKPGFSLLFDGVMKNEHFIKHQVEAHFDVLRRFLGVEKIDDAGLEMVIPEAARQKADRLWQESFTKEAKVVAFNIGASWLTKRWLKEYFAECADRLIRRGYHVAFFGGPMDLELVESCIEDMQERESHQLKVFTGKVSLGVLAGLLRRCCLFLTTDSGPMHVGVAMNVPIVTMFGASPVTGFCPYDGKDILVKTPAPCHPCRIHECPKAGAENLMCMRDIPVDTVMECVDELLEKFGGEPAYKLPLHPGDYKCRVIDLGHGIAPS